MKKCNSLFIVNIWMSMVSWYSSKANTSCNWFGLIISFDFCKSAMNYTNISINIFNLLIIFNLCLHFKETVIFWKHEHFLFIPIEYLIQLLLLFFIVFSIRLIQYLFIQFLDVIRILLFQIWKIIWILSLNFL